MIENKNGVVNEAMSMEEDIDFGQVCSFRICKRLLVCRVQRQLGSSKNYESLCFLCR